MLLLYSLPILLVTFFFFFFFFNDTATTEIYTLSLHDALPIYQIADMERATIAAVLESCHGSQTEAAKRSEEHTSELQSRRDLVCRLLLEKKKKKHNGKCQQTNTTDRYASEHND